MVHALFCGHHISGPAINGTLHYFVVIILACRPAVKVTFLFSPVFTPTVWGCIGLIMLIMGPILWILHRTTPYYEYAASLFLLSKIFLKVPRHVLKARSLEHQLLFLHLLWKPDATRINNSACCRQRVTFFANLPHYTSIFMTKCTQS